MITSKDQLPVHLLTGFLGAGKTTLLNRMMADPALRDTALVINEFGLVPVDHDLVRKGREQPMVTTTGCICCTAGSDLRSSLDQLLHGRRTGNLPPFRRVIVETTGLADPAPILNSLIPGGRDARSLADHAVARAFRLSGVIAVVDVEGIEAALAAHPESLRQIAFADHAVLTRTDRTPAGDWPGRLRAINTGISVHDAADPGFDPARLLRPGSYEAFGKGENVAAWLAAEAAAGTHGHGGLFHGLNRHGHVVAVPLLGSGPIEAMALQRFLHRLTATPENGLLRIKGLVALRDDPSRPAVVHAVGHRLYPIRRIDAWPGGAAETRLVLIGTALDETALRHDFASLTAAPDAALQAALSEVLQSFLKHRD
ncbi:GTP-binding protein [Rhodovulum sp. BSW8]|uniref:CobW family GTP-binding protein n=1 Tax=Rhodovulum sp. BSW8 TaxID=2259645 RepID=UPI000DE5670B|nr:GTP-binding protein [Rhodovulum sp. BSW8]RBO53852.1 GTP-binding protein [Rhodovulum sp. BSW8]